MNNELVQISDFVSIAETVLLLVVSYIGTIIHEYIFIPGKTKFIKNIRVWLTVIMNFIICYSINPYIVNINPRLILLPPLILGLLGNELAVRMGTIKGSTSFIEYILGFFGIKNKLNKEERSSLGVEEHREVPQQIIKETQEQISANQSNIDAESENKINNDISNINQNKESIQDNTNLNNNEDTYSQTKINITKNKNDQSNSVENFNQEFDKEEEDFYLSKSAEEKLKDLNQMAYIVLNEIDMILLEYYEEEDCDKFIENYLKIKPKIKQFSKDFKQYEYLPLNTTLKISEIVNKQNDLDTLYRTLVQTSQNSGNTDET